MNNKLSSVVQLITATLCLSATTSEIKARVAASDRVDWSMLLGYADEHELTPLLYDVWKQAGALSIVPPAIQAEMARVYEDNQRRNRQIRAELIEIFRILTQAEVPHLLLGGWALVERLYPDPAYRVLPGHAFLVAPDAFQTGRQLLAAAGFKPNADASLWHKGGYLPVELRTSLWNQGWQGLQVDEPCCLWRDAQTRLVAGVSMPVLSDEHTAIQLAVNFSSYLVEGQARLNQLFDVACLLQQSPHLDWERIWAEITQTGLSRFVYAAIFMAHRVFDAPLPPPNIWKRLASVTPSALVTWLEKSTVVELFAADNRQSLWTQNYHLAFVSAVSLRERLGIIRLAMLPPIEKVVVEYKLAHRWLAPLLYPRYVVERVSEYSRIWFAGL